MEPEPGASQGPPGISRDAALAVFLGAVALFVYLCNAALPVRQEDGGSEPTVIHHRLGVSRAAGSLLLNMPG